NRANRHTHSTHPLNQPDAQANIHQRLCYSSDGGEMLSACCNNHKCIWIAKLANEISNHEHGKIRRALDCVVLAYPQRKERVGAKQNGQAADIEDQSTIS